jgi:hypothetical protein
MNTRLRGGSIYYPFHPRCGETVLIRRRLEYRGLELVVILQPDNSFACIPAWMSHEAAAQYAVREKPCFSVDILRSLRAEIDALLGFLRSESKTEETRGGPSTEEPSTQEPQLDLFVEGGP